MKLTQHQLIIEFIKQKGSILPAKMGGYQFMGEIFGSETNRRARELRKRGILRSEKEGRFERFFLVAVPMKVYRVVGERGETLKTIKLL